MKKMICVTGGAGFIGSHLVKRLVKEQYSVILSDRFSKNKTIKENRIRSFSKNPLLTLASVDITNVKSVAKLFKNNTIDTLIHLASQANVPLSIADPIMTVNINIIGTSILFEQAIKHHVSHIIFSSSALVYNQGKPPFKENDPCNLPASPYAQTMRTVELMGYTTANLHNIHMTGLRLFPVVGPWMREDLFIPTIVSSLQNNKPIKILGNGKTKRSFIYIDDVVDAFMSAITKPKKYQMINIGNPTPISYLDLIKYFETIMGTKATLKFTKEKDIEGDLYPNIQKAKTLLGFSPKIPLEEGLRRYVSWWQSSVKSR